VPDSHPFLGIALACRKLIYVASLTFDGGSGSRKCVDNGTIFGAVMGLIDGHRPTPDVIGDT
jgi:hypothetical protein